MKKKALIVGAGRGNVKGVDFSQYTFIMGCDGGTQYLSDASETPHAIIGDFDSVDVATLMEMEMLGVPRHTLSTEKDFTDMKHAVDFITRYDYEEIDIYGALGSRMDHSLGNMLLLFDLLEKGVEGRIMDETNRVSALMAKGGRASKELTDVPEGWFVSVLPVGDCKGVEIRGLKYELPVTDLTTENAGRCISNQVVEGQVGQVSLEEGKLLLIYSVDED